MIYYFSGTGNSLAAAQQLAQETDDHIRPMVQLQRQSKPVCQLAPGERLGFVFPVYFWGVPTFVRDFMRALSVPGCEKHYIYVVLTYGTLYGGTLREAETILSSVGMALRGGFAVRMPENYIVLFSPPSDTKRDRILQTASQKLSHIARDIHEQRMNRRPALGETLLSLVGKPIHGFYRRQHMARHFSITDKCVGCGLCARVCPCGTIRLSLGRPLWSGDCTQCFACINRCPQQAIECSFLTMWRRRYCHPDLPINSHPHKASPSDLHE